MVFLKYIIEFFSVLKKIIPGNLAGIDLIIKCKMLDVNFYNAFLFFFLVFWSFCPFRAPPMAYGGSQGRGLIRAVAANHSHSHAKSKPCLQPTPQFTATPDP